MKKPEALAQLLEELLGENIVSQVEVLADSKAVIYPNDDAASDENGIHLNGAECRMVFANASTVERLFDALGDPQDASLALFDVTVPGDMLDILEQKFIAVDEG